MPKSVVAPLDVRRDPLGVGAELLGVSRSEVNRQLKVIEFRVQEFGLPRVGEATGWQRLILGSDNLAASLIGTPLVDEEGRLAAIVLDAEGRALGVDVLEMSLGRLGAGGREFDPLKKLGLNLAYSFSPAIGDAGTVAFTPTIVAVTPGSPAAGALLQRGDRIVTIGETTITWETNVAEQLSVSLPLKMTVRRDEKVVSATIQAASTP
jgi:membrane-associated protease RseP (regulator of RpoE activity)